MPSRAVPGLDEEYRRRLSRLEAEVSALKSGNTAASVLFNAFLYVGFGFAIQILAYGEAPWTSMAMVAHVTGWPLFVLVWAASAIFHFGLWAALAGILGAVLIYAAFRVCIWFRRRKFHADLDRRFSRHSDGRGTAPPTGA